jgi:uncharacterized protein
MNVESTSNLTAISAALTSAGNKDFTVIALPRLNHFFQTAQLGTPRESDELEETFAPLALELISDWLGRHAGPGSAAR